MAQKGWKQRLGSRAGSDGGSPVRRIAAVVVGLVGIYLVVCLALGWYVSREPDLFDVSAYTQQMSNALGRKVVVGSTTTAALIGVASTLLDKPGGYLRNDVMPPGVWVDDMPNWEYGVLIQVRDMARALRDSFSRSQSQSKEDVDLALAEPHFNFQADSWMLPSSESEYREGIARLKRYLVRLSDPDNPQAQFYARADNLRYWLEIVSSRLGSLSQRLTASVGQRRINTDLAGEPAARQSTRAAGEETVKTPWTEIDDVFYQARGTTWALVELLRAVRVDFAGVLANKNATVSLEQIIRELERTQQPVFSPVILNGSGFGILANHSLVMASYISRANAALIDLRELLARG